MATELEHISKILPKVWEDLKEFNDRFDERERNNGRSILPTSDAGITRTTDKTTGECK
jgi:hypothetical protein